MSWTRTRRSCSATRSSSPRWLIRRGASSSSCRRWRMSGSCARAPFLMSLLAGACLTQALAAADTKAPAVGVSVAQIVEKHVAARGGLKAWRTVQTLSMSGKLDAGTPDSIERSAKIARQGMGASVKAAPAAAAQGGTDKTAQQVQLPFRLEMKAPVISRRNIEFAGKTAVQVYDGQQ